MRRLVNLLTLTTAIFLGSAAVIAAFSSHSLASSRSTDLSLIPGDSVSLYRQNCGACHGERGDGRGPAGRAMRPPAANFLTMPDTTSVEYIFRIMTQGKGSMPAFRNLNDGDRRSIAQYIGEVFIPSPRKR